MSDRISVIGLTGPTGAGKSEVARVLEQRGFPVIDADVLARRAVEPGTECLRKLTGAFGDILNPDGTLNRRELAKRAFATEKGSRLLNSITHPYIILLSENILMQWERDHKTAAVIDAPLLYESGMDSICDKTVVVIAPFETRLRRIMARDGLTGEQARHRMAAQQSDEYYTSRADLVLHSEGSLDDLREQAEKLALQIREWTNGL